MPRPELLKLNLQPGINTQATQTANEGRWSTCNLIRWKDGFLEKIGGWERLTATQLAGLSRGLHAFQDMDGNDYVLSGSNQSLQVYFNGTIYTLDLYGETHELANGWLISQTIGPTTYTINDPDAAVLTGDTIHIDVPAAVSTISLPATVYTVNSGDGSGAYSIATSIAATGVDTGGEPPGFLFSGVGGPFGNIPNPVVVALAGHGLSEGEVFTIQVATNLGGASLFGDYIVQDVIDADSFIISSATTPAIGSTAYELEDLDGNPVGRVSYETPVPAGTKNWSIDNFGQIAVACYQDGPLLTWLPPITSNTAAVGVISAPSINAGLFVAMPQAQVISYGSEANGIQDPLLVRFSDAGNVTGWTASATNQAGSYRLSRGSKIVGGIQAPQQTLLWTDIDLWSMQYVGPPFVYSFNIMQTGCGLIAPRARVVLYGQTYWMSQKQFFTFGAGGVSVLPCEVWDEVFNNLDEDNLNIICAGSNAGFNEIMFYYPSASGGTGEIDSYVKYNVVSQKWDYGTLGRTAWIDQSVLGTPIGVDLDRRFQQHEVGYDDDDGPMEDVFAETGFIDLGDGTEFSLVSQVIPDFKWFGENGYVKLTLFAKNYPADPGIKYGPWTINANTRMLPTRVRARQIAYRIEWGATTGFSARLGAMRYQIQPSGRR